MFRVDLDQLRMLSPEFARIAGAAHQKLTTLEASLAAEGRCWGDDEPGRMFGEQYEPQAEDGMAALRTVIENLHRLGAGVHYAADIFANQDVTAAQQVHGSWYPEIPANHRHPTVEPSTPTVRQPVELDTAPSIHRPAISGSDTGAGPTAEVGSSSPSSPPEVTGNHVPGHAPATDPGQSTDVPAPARVDAGAPAGAPTQPSTPVSPRGAVASTSVAPVSATTAPATRPSTVDTPWSRPAGTVASGLPSHTSVVAPEKTQRPAPSSVSPWQRPANTYGTGRGQIVPPSLVTPAPVPPALQRGKKSPPGSAEKPDKSVRTRPRRRPGPAAAAAIAVLDDLADRHGLRLVGFTDSGIDRHTAREIAAAVDLILGKHAFVDLIGLAALSMPDERFSSRHWALPAYPPSGGWIVLQPTAIPGSGDVAMEVSTASGAPVQAVTTRPVYSALVHEFGGLLADTLDPRTLRLTEQTLLTEYRRISGPWGDKTLATVVREYRAWRDQLGRTCIEQGRLDPHNAMTVAFAEVELRADAACGPAKALHRLLIETARGRSLR
ncbi:hypothetical protein IU453_11980 [Nocardia cyriacigeorgica]|uniref:WXG100 family type VII secretion target n=1 Tax=Nocardia cyriacigeorgica TaxID=135487 RepID=UPI001895ED10|nr:WXG100 family type VII secretion target [Nocardia cyriacigeorgica]MBF6317486.1 hypothetical protein [Nocardia cyriacigeorgica]MBF6531962.1 hypothetical protein [Nocardia cyriacigeorgica]